MRNPDGPNTGRPSTYGPRGMVATSYHLATGAGVNALRRGGSAVDAGIAANAVLCVAYPHMAGLGGDGFWMIASPDGEVQAINASGPAAAMATREFYAGRGHEEEIPARGPLAALTIPGAIDGWRLAHERYGRLDWEELFADAIELAQNGVPVGLSLAKWTATDEEILAGDERAGSIFLPGGRVPREGDRLIQSDLAASLREVASRGPREGFYEGDLGRRLCEVLAEAGSPLRPEDLAGFRAEWVDPIRFTYKGLDLYEFPPNTQGFAALQILNLVEGLDLRAMGDGSADFYHHFAEAVKLAFADRNAWLTDPKFADIPLDRLLDKDYARQRRELIDPERAMVMADVEPGVPGPGAGAGRSAEGDTCYFCAWDADGLGVSLIQSIFHDFGAGIVAGDTGIVPQNRGSFFSLDPDHVNTLEPGKRTFHTLIPALTKRGGELELLYGTMGGEGQPQTHAALICRLEDFGYGIQQAIEAPRWLMGRTWGTKSQDLSLEGRISDGVILELKRRGQPIKMLPHWDDNMGHAQAIRRHAGSGLLEGGADPRGDGAAIGY